jgi:hypothetical protein
MYVSYTTLNVMLRCKPVNTTVFSRIELASHYILDLDS